MRACTVHGFALLLFLNLPLLLRAQPSNPDTAAAFPASWAGVWEGDLVISTAAGVAQTIPMQLHLLPVADSIYTWTIIYGADTVAGRRPYLLKSIDRAKGVYVIDEQNSIGLESYLIGQTLYSWFEVEGNLLTTMVEPLEDGRLLYEIVSGKSEPVSTTGQQIVEGEEIPEVKAFPVRVRQRAYLRRR